MNPVAVLLLHQRQQRRSSASLSMWPAIPEPCRHRNIASSAGPWRRGHATPHKRLSCLVFHNELHELDELSPLEKVLNHGLHEFFILHSSRQSSRIRLIRVIRALFPPFSFFFLSEAVFYFFRLIQPFGFLTYCRDLLYACPFSPTAAPKTANDKMDWRIFNDAQIETITI